MGILLFCNVDQDGKIIESLYGERTIPQKQYEHFFYLYSETEETVADKLPYYHVIDGQLI